ncbi:MAG: hypothetical protein QGI78_03395 [Phycisphaerales bacterium]|jgi:hypothetical protein|nr:hypothetical protein [Phycisphaerales bacterium]
MTDINLTVHGQNGQANCGDPNSLESFSVQPDPKLLAEGWERRQLADPDRAKEAVELYESLGFEVLAKELDESDFGDACKTCAVAGCNGYVMIYTRKKK